MQRKRWKIWEMQRIIKILEILEKVTRVGPGAGRDRTEVGRRLYVSSIIRKRNGRKGKGQLGMLEGPHPWALYLGDRRLLAGRLVSEV